MFVAHVILPYSRPYFAFIYNERVNVCCQTISELFSAISWRKHSMKIGFLQCQLTETTVHGQTCRSTWTHYTDTEPTFLCSYSLKLRLFCGKAANTSFIVVRLTKIYTVVRKQKQTQLLARTTRTFIATFQQHLHMEYISLRWSDIPELAVPIRISLIDCCW